MSAITHLTLEQFHERYTDADKPYYEYWHGEAIQKNVPTRAHSYLQAILAQAFEAAGYHAGPELTLRIDPDWEPVPDVAASLSNEQPYPTKPIEIVAEVLSPKDRPAHVLDKCRHYQNIGIGQIYVFDPELRTAQIWNSEHDKLDSVDRLALGNGVIMQVDQLWLALDGKLGN
jgi:Uma2 family endonuclease